MFSVAAYDQRPPTIGQRPIMNFALDSATRRRLGYQLIDAIDQYFSTLDDRPVQLPAEQRTYGPLPGAIPESPSDPESLLQQACREMIEKGFHVTSANYYGLMNPTPTYIGVLGEALVAALNPQIATLARSQLASRMEQQTVRWICEQLYPQLVRPEDDDYLLHAPFDGTFTSGGNEANFSGLALGLAAKFPDAIEDGIASIGARPLVYASAESHHSLDKSAGLLGLGRNAVRRIPVDDRIHMRMDLLDQAIRDDLAAGHRPFCVVATAGTTNSGAVDDLEAAADLCARHHLWLHVDGAYGAAAVFSRNARSLVRGIERADSITIDPHKWLAMPFAAGVIATRHPQMLQRAFAVSTPYMPKASGAVLPDNWRISTQWSRRANAIKLWLSLQVYGRRAYEQHIDRQLELARKFAAWVRSSERFELASEPDLTIINFRVKGVPPEQLAAANDAVVDRVTRDGQRWISTTMVAGASVIRMMVISYLTSEQNLSDLQAALTAAVARSLHRASPK